MSDQDNFQLNIDAVRNLVGSTTNKTFVDAGDSEGIEGQYSNDLSVKLTDAELLELAKQYENEWSGYYPKVKARQETNKLYLSGRQRMKAGSQAPVSSNLLFEATATFVPAALAKNPEPVVWSDNTPQGKAASSDLKTTLQFHAETLGLREKLSTMVWHWSVYFTAVLKYGWDTKTNDVKMEVRKPQNFILDPNGYVDEFGNFVGWLGERIETTARKMIEMFPKHKEYITIKVNGKLGTKCVYTEWWDDEMCFSTFYDVVLDAHKNEFFNYGKEAEVDEMGMEITPAVEAQNHFAAPLKPYTFLSVFSLQEEPHDFTNLIEQNLSNQDQINDRDVQIDKNARQGNNSMIVSGLSFNQETAHQAAQAVEDGDPILVPDGNMDSVKRIPANSLPNGLMQAQENNKNTLRSIYGTTGVTALAPNEDETAHGMVINGNRDSSRIGGGIGDSLERVAKGAFNYLTQLYYVFYDEPHFASIMGNGAAVSYVMLQMQDQTRRFVVSVAPNSMKPKDEITDQNMAVELANTGWLDPLSLFERLDDPDPVDTAKKVVLWKTNPQLYQMTYFPEQAPAPGPIPTDNPPDMATAQGQAPTTLSAPVSSADLSQAPLPRGQMPNIG